MKNFIHNAIAWGKGFIAEHLLKTWLSLFLLLISPGLWAQPDPFEDDGILEVFIDCQTCDMNFIRQEIKYVNHVRDQQLAQVYVFITWNQSGSGGRIYNLAFTGNKNFDGINNKLQYTTEKTTTDAEELDGLVNIIEMGLVAYLAHTHMTKAMSISINESASDNQQTVLEDPWGNWVFDIVGQVNFDENRNRSEFQIRSGIEADRVTENWRIRLDLQINNRDITIESDDEKISSSRRINAFSASVVKSLGDHWSAGAFGSIGSNTFNNIRRRLWLAPALEYSFFPYAEVLRKEITIAYRIGYVNQFYIEETISEQKRDILGSQSLSIRVQYRQPWGRISTNLAGSSFLHDFSQNRLELESFISIRVFKGLSARLSTEFQIIRDQVNLPKGDATLEDILLQQRATASDFSFFLGIGLNYTFGSIYNNILNTRL